MGNTLANFGISDKCWRLIKRINAVDAALTVVFILIFALIFILMLVLMLFLDRPLNGLTLLKKRCIAHRCLEEIA